MIVKPFRSAIVYALTLLVVGLSTPAQAQPHKTSDNLLIVPGQHLGRVFLGDSKAAVRRRLGAPQSSFKLVGGLTSELWRSKTDVGHDGKFNTLEVVYQRGVVTQIEATSLSFQTVRGLSTSDNYDRWLKTYGIATPRRYSYPKKGSRGYKGGQIYYDWANKGLALELAFGEDAEDVYIHTVIVHRKGANVVVDAGGRLVS